MANIFRGGDPGSNNMANKGLQYIDVYHVPTGKSVQFKAILTEFSDQYTSEWEGTTSFGRMDAIQNFKRTGRSISIGFDVVAYSLLEAQENMSNISSLVQFLYPAYDGQNQMSNSPLCKIQFKNWSFDASRMQYSTAKESGLLGAIAGFSFSPDLDSGVYNDDGGDGKPNPTGNIYCKKTTISFEFAVIHQHELGWKKSDLGWGPRSDNGEAFPYNAFVDELAAQADATGASKESTAQQKAVPNDAKNQHSANTMTDNAKARSLYPGVVKTTPAMRKAREKSYDEAVKRRQRRLQWAAEQSWDED